MESGPTSFHAKVITYTMQYIVKQYADYSSSSPLLAHAVVRGLKPKTRHCYAAPTGSQQSQTFSVVTLPLPTGVLRVPEQALACMQPNEALPPHSRAPCVAVCAVHVVQQVAPDQTFSNMCVPAQRGPFSPCTQHGPLALRATRLTHGVPAALCGACRGRPAAAAPRQHVPAARVAVVGAVGQTRNSTYTQALALASKPDLTLYMGGELGMCGWAAAGMVCWHGGWCFCKFLAMTQRKHVDGAGQSCGPCTLSACTSPCLADFSHAARWRARSESWASINKALVTCEGDQW